MGSVLGFFLAFTNLYIGLKTGWYLGVAITAVILSFSISTLLERMGIAKSAMSILENNCMQSCASCAGYGTGSTIFTAVPALLLLTTTPDRRSAGTTSRGGSSRSGPSCSRGSG